jgi:hypothetical protein
MPTWFVYSRRRILKQLRIPGDGGTRQQRENAIIPHAKIQNNEIAPHRDGP